MRKPKCAECKRLWEDYTAATFVYARVDSKLKMAVLRDDVIDELMQSFDTAYQRRDAALERFQQHEGSHTARAASA